ncbi:MAG: B12-binding domain-containing radical SAM protein, partial [Deltaproteobacteria bacterium]|nr:B12-binding domain-containing radical SAM protein [Deltaproteobacteria bacterium]
MKVLLVSANRLTVPFPVYPLGLDYVAGALQQHHEVRILDLCAAGDGALARQLQEMQPELVGISVRNVDNTDLVEQCAFVDDLRRLVAAVRACSFAPVVLGGAGYSIFPDELLALAGA